MYILLECIPFFSHSNASIIPKGLILTEVRYSKIVCQEPSNQYGSHCNQSRCLIQDLCTGNKFTQKLTPTAIGFVTFQVQGIGPLFQLTVGVETISRQQSATNLCLVFHWDETLYSLSKKIIQV